MWCARLKPQKTDERISGLVLDLGGLGAGSSDASKLHRIANAIQDFKAGGEKKVIAVGDGYTQEQYLLAAQADKILMDDYGGVIIYGYGRYNVYLKSLLEKLKITSHVFRVGTYKAAVEPFLREDMSPEAKEANAAYLSVLWREMGRTIEAGRSLEAGSVGNYVNNFGSLLREQKGDFAKTAKASGLVDNLLSRAERNDYLVRTFGKAKSENKDDETRYKSVGFDTYLTALGAPEDGEADNIALITAAGTIIDGEAPAGQAAGGDTIAGLLKKAREDDDVKAVVLRVDSPGGSAFASDVIRDEVLAIKKAGKPFVVSMGSLAASGGYWIAAPADEIWAAPTTITGSIGIFGYFQTYENAAEWAGISVDGVGTTSLSPILATGLGPLPDNIADIFQQSVENGYDRFLGVVADGRGLDKAYVDTIAQGRVWVGETAKELKLVDELGTLDDAVASAAELAGLEEFDLVEMDEDLTPFEEFVRGLSAKAVAKLSPSQAKQAGAVMRVVDKAAQEIEFLGEFNDPNAIYARCMACSQK